MKKYICAIALLLPISFYGCASTSPLPGYYAEFNSTAQLYHHRYCENQKCLFADCFSEHVTELCNFKGDSSLREKLFKNITFANEKSKTNLWETHCTPLAINSRVICHEGNTKIEKPKDSELVDFNEETFSGVQDGKNFVIYRQVYILKP